jgi:hypothetical protein
MYGNLVKRLAQKHGYPNFPTRRSSMSITLKTAFLFRANHPVANVEDIGRRGRDGSALLRYAIAFVH